MFSSLCCLQTEKDYREVRAWNRLNEQRSPLCALSLEFSVNQTLNFIEAAVWNSECLKSC